MRRLILTRIGVGLLTLWAVSLMVFLGTQLLPGDVAQAALGQLATPQLLAQTRHDFGLDRPVLVRYGAWLAGVVCITRAVAVDIATQEFVEAAVARGESLLSILLHDILPNIWTPVLADFGIRLTGSVILFSSLSYLGFGQAPPAADWGLMISENRAGMIVQPWVVVLPAATIALLAIGVNLMADGVARRRPFAGTARCLSPLRPRWSWSACASRPPAARTASRAVARRARRWRCWGTPAPGRALPAARSCWAARRCSICQPRRCGWRAARASPMCPRTPPPA